MLCCEENFIIRMGALERLKRAQTDEESIEEVAGAARRQGADIKRLIAIAQKLTELGINCWDYMKFSKEEPIAFVANYNTQKINHLGYSTDGNRKSLVLFDGITGTLVKGKFTEDNADEFEEELEYFKEDFYQFVDEILGLDLYRDKDD